MESAKASEERWNKGSPIGALDGIPISIKDIILTKGWPTLRGSRTIDPNEDWDEDSPSVARLKEAGAVLFGKTTTPEFGWKGMTDSPLSRITRNPWDLERTPGGSSGGSAAAVAAGIGPLAYGNDGGGSIRIPSSYCGLYGVKPTFGRVPQYPQEGPFCTLVSGGPIARSMMDAAMMLNEIAKPDPRDWYALPYDGRDYIEELEKDINGLKIAYSPDLGEAVVEKEVLEIVNAAVDKFSDLGAIVERVGSIFSPLRPDFEKYWLAGFAYTLSGIEPEKHDLMDKRFRELAERGTVVGMKSYCTAVTCRAALGAKMAQFHTEYDLLLTPTMPTPPPSVETQYHSEEFDRWDHGVPFTVPFNLTGQPAASVPCGLTKEGLPVGLQIVGAKYREDLVLRAARAFEKVSPLQWPNPVMTQRIGEMEG
jgi:aspartyl-tRNA(Asn)/glutamyl-tRNA(Gln) amidotransferase subunit A